MMRLLVFGGVFFPGLLLGVKFNLTVLNPEWVKDNSHPQVRKPDGTVVRELYKRNEPLSGIFRATKPVITEEFDWFFAEHARQIDQLINDPKVADEAKPRRVDYRKIGEEYLMTLTKPVEAGRCQVIFSAYRITGIEQIIIDVPTQNEDEGYRLGKAISGLANLDRLPTMNPLEGIAPTGPSDAYGKGYESGRKLGGPVFAAFAVLVGGVVIVFLWKRLHQSPEQAGPSHFSIDQMNRQDVPDAGLSDTD